MNQHLESLINIADELAQKEHTCRDTILINLLCHQLLTEIAKSPLGKRLVLTSSAALRFCHNNPRLSANVSFLSRKSPLNNDDYQLFKNLIRERFSINYGLACQTRNNDDTPELSRGHRPGRVNRWTAILETNEIRIKGASISIDVCNAPAQEPGHHKISLLNPGALTKAVKISVCSGPEILAGKILDLIEKPIFQADTVWDIYWLIQECKVTVNPELILKKAALQYKSLTSGRIHESLSAIGLKILSSEIRDHFQSKILYMFAANKTGNISTQPEKATEIIQKVSQELISLASALKYHSPQEAGVLI